MIFIVDTIKSYLYVLGTFPCLRNVFSIPLYLITAIRMKLLNFSVSCCQVNQQYGAYISNRLIRFFRTLNSRQLAFICHKKPAGKKFTGILLNSYISERRTSVLVGVINEAHINSCKKHQVYQREYQRKHQARIKGG